MLIRDKDKQSLIEIFSSVEIPIEVWAYGSRVNGIAYSGSDLDLVVRSPDLEKLPVDVIKRLNEKIQFSNIPIVVELFDWARLPESFHKNINNQHEVLFSTIEIMVNEPPEQYRKTSADKKDN